jgi:hypothetical protein
MPEFFVPAQPVFAREYGQGSRLSTVTRDLEAEVDGLAGTDLNVQLRESVPPGASVLAVQGSVIAAAPAGAQLFASRGGQGFTSTTAAPNEHIILIQNIPAVHAAQPIDFDNGNVALFDDWDRILQLRGAAGAAVDALGPPPPMELRGTVTYEFPRCMIGMFANDADDTLPGIGNLVANTLRNMGAQGDGRTNIGVLLNGSTPNLVLAGAAFPRADNNYYVLTADIGLGAGQIPAAGDEANYTAAKFNNHPCAFLPKASQIRGLQFPVRFPVVQNAITNPEAIGAVTDSGVRVYTVVRAPTHSRWLLEIDGAPMDVIIAHPANSDLRRPRDIFNQVLAPAFFQGGQQIPIFAQVALGGVRLFFQTGSFRDGSFVQCATFVEPFDGDSADITVLESGGAN